MVEPETSKYLKKNVERYAHLEHVVNDQKRFQFEWFSIGHYDSYQHDRNDISDQNACSYFRVLHE